VLNDLNARGAITARVSEIARTRSQSGADGAVTARRRDCERSTKSGAEGDATSAVGKEEGGCDGWR